MVTFDAEQSDAYGDSWYDETKVKRREVVRHSANDQEYVYSKCSHYGRNVGLSALMTHSSVDWSACAVHIECNAQFPLRHFTKSKLHSIVSPAMNG